MNGLSFFDKNGAAGTLFIPKLAKKDGYLFSPWYFLCSQTAVLITHIKETNI
jgi:hypothetical protein